MKFINRIKHIFEKKNYPCRISQEGLIVNLNTDYQNRVRFLEIVHSPQPIQSEEGEKPYCRLQFKSHFPFLANEMVLNQVASLLLFLNPMLPIPGFELNELTNQISFRYVWVGAEENIDHHLLFSIIGNLMAALDIYGYPIEEVAAGKSSFNDLLERIVKTNADLAG